MGEGVGADITRSGDARHYAMRMYVWWWSPCTPAMYMCGGEPRACLP